MRGLIFAAPLLSFLLLAACASGPTLPQAGTISAAASVAGDTVFITSNGWHTGIVVAAKAIPPGRIPETADFSDARYFEFGWGDAEYYPARQPTVGMTLRAALMPTAAVVHIAALRDLPARVYPRAEVIALTLMGGQQDRLLAHIAASFERGAGRRAISTGPGLYADSHFYPATGRFHLANTCNSWTARGLVAAGLKVDPSEAARAEDLMVQLRPLADVRP
jgi:uncharacterized protein (TIGR02117 family)